MARNINVWMTNWHWTGSDVPVPQAEVNIRLEWVGDDGAPSEWEGVATFPNCLQDVPVPWVREALEDLILRAVRRRLGAD